MSFSHSLGAGLVVLVVETDEVSDVLLVVEGDQAIGKDECGIGGRRLVGGVRAAVGLEFIAQVARITAIEVERQAFRVDVALAQLPVEVTENGFRVGRVVAAMFDRHLLRSKVIAHELRVRTAGITHVGEAGEFTDQGAVEPEGGLGVRVQVHEHLLGIEGHRQASVIHREVLAVQRSSCGLTCRLDGVRRGYDVVQLRRSGRANLVGTAPSRRITAAVFTGERPEVVQQAMSKLGADRFRVELNTPDRPGLVPHAHQDPVLGPCQRLELVGEFRHVERVIANGGKRRRNAGENLDAGVVYAAGPAVHHLRNVVHLATEQVAETLVTQAHTEHGDGGLEYRLSADSEIAFDLRAPWSR